MNLFKNRGFIIETMGNKNKIWQGMTFIPKGYYFQPRLQECENRVWKWLREASQTVRMIVF